MLIPPLAVQEFNKEFSITINVLTGVAPFLVPLPVEPEVSVVEKDPGIIITKNDGSATISGKYTAILKTTWTWLDNNFVSHTTDYAPLEGTYSKITAVSTPPVVQKDCIYTINGETFTHTVTIITYDRLKDEMKALLEKGS